MKVQGYCPMGCGPTLAVTTPADDAQLMELTPGIVVCTAQDCPDPNAVHKILSDPETEHVVTLRRRTFAVKHPLRERVGDEMLDCGLDQQISRMGPPKQLGTFRVTKQENGNFKFERIRDGAERVGPTSDGDADSRAGGQEDDSEAQEVGA